MLMKWKKFTLTTTTEAVDLVSSMFDDIGIEGIEIEDNIPLTEKETKGMFIDILPELPPDEGIAKVSFYLDDDADVAEMLKKVNEGLDELALFTDLGARTIEASETEDKDWINNWKQYFKPFTVDHILIVNDISLKHMEAVAGNGVSLQILSHCRNGIFIQICSPDLLCSQL